MSKGRWKPGILRDKVLLAFDRHPSWTSFQLGELLKVHPAYVRKTLARNGRKLLRRHGQKLLEAAE